MAPAPYKMEREQDKIGADGKPVLDQDGEPVKEVVEIKVNAFKPVSTFDISQTDGEPVPISFENIETGAKGSYIRLHCLRTCVAKRKTCPLNCAPML